jgi:GWxTD domain-containing protein
LTCSGTPERRSLLPAGLCAVLLAGLLAAGCGSAPARRTAVDLTNPFLGPEYSQWLVGAVALLATPEEVEGFLALQDDAAAGQFVRQFWERRDPAPERPGNPLLEAFEQRAAVADRLYSEAGYAGRRTARGTLFILYGRPKSVDFEVASQEGAPPIEVWTYGGDSPAGLTGRPPEPVYRFVKRGDLTVPYLPLGRPETVPGRVPGRLALAATTAALSFWCRSDLS